MDFRVETDDKAHLKLLNAEEIDAHTFATYLFRITSHILLHVLRNSDRSSG